MVEDNGANGRIRLSVLLLLCVQNAGHALLTRYSQGILKESYSSTEVVLVAEIIKLFASGYLAMTDKAETDAIGSGITKLLWLTIHAKKIIVLVFLYAMANLLSYYALARVDASVYTVLLQLKIMTTAFFAVLILGRNISSTKWRSLILLVIGCVLVASPTFNRPVDCDEIKAHRMLAALPEPLSGSVLGDEEVLSVWQSLVGVLAVLLMVTISGVSAIYFEYILKVGEKVTIWERNFQLALYSTLLLVAFVVYEVNDGTTDNLVFFRGWTVNTLMIALIQAAGGLLVAATLKYADAVLKTLATSGSIVLSAVLGFMLLGGVLDIFVSIGCVATILAIFNYTLDTTVE